MKAQSFFKNIKVLLVGLGVLGGGVAMSKFILKEKKAGASNKITQNQTLEK